MSNYRKNLVSVIIPVFNSERYIASAVESVLKQTYKEFELIVVNDGSTDKTVKVLEQYIDRIHYAYQPNKGVAAARNAGIRASKGEYIAFLDSDDLWIRDTLILHVNYLQNNPNIGLVYGEVLVIDERGKRRELFRWF